MKKLVIGADHAGYELKQYLIDQLSSMGYEMEDKGTYSSESTDYPDYAHAVADAVVSTGVDGILICGSASGVCITANKHQGVRAAQCWIPQIASLARQHNNANIICIPARFVAKEFALEIAEAFLNAEFEGGRHERRVNKIACS